MSVQDADCLGRCITGNPEDPLAALCQYQAERLPQTTQEVCSLKPVRTGRVHQEHAVSMGYGGLRWANRMPIQSSLTRLRYVLCVRKTVTGWRRENALLCCVQSLVSQDMQ